MTDLSVVEADITALGEVTGARARAAELVDGMKLLALLRGRGRTTPVSLHDLNAAAPVPDRLHVLHEGHVVASGPPREVLRPELPAEVFGVRAAVVTHPLTGDPLIAFDHRRPVDGTDGPRSRSGEENAAPGLPRPAATGSAGR